MIELVRQKLRGPYLGRLELHRVMNANNCNPNEVLGDFIELLIEYFKIFGDKPCCARDIILFLDYLDTSQRAKLMQRLQEECKVSLTILPQSVSTFPGFEMFVRQNHHENFYLSLFNR